MTNDSFLLSVKSLAEMLDPDRESFEQVLEIIENGVRELPPGGGRELQRDCLVIASGLTRLRMRLVKSGTRSDANSK
jgi:hypothetical protein